MAGPLRDLIEAEFRATLAIPDFRLSLDGRFGSAAPDSRARLRADVESSLGPLIKATDLGPLRDLQQIPLRVGGGYLSISHTEELGGWVFGSRPLGFDLEVAARVKDNVVGRIAAADEMAAAPSAAELWAAKESVFKVLAHAIEQPTVVSQFEITGWIGRNFRVKTPSKFFSNPISGCVISQQGFVFSVASFSP